MLHNQIKDLYMAIELKKATAKLRLNIKKSKKKKWNEFIEEIDPRLSSKEVWRKINLLND